MPSTKDYADFILEQLSGLPEASMAIPYEGAKPMLLVDNVDNRDFLKSLILAMYDELPEMKKKRK